jgi:hypothetical protein
MEYRMYFANSFTEALYIAFSLELPIDDYPVLCPNKILNLVDSLKNEHGCEYSDLIIYLQAMLIAGNLEGYYIAIVDGSVLSEKTLPIIKDKISGG